ncbi:MAG TPA: CBS domain-containing protein [Bryobacteraceae bacterium]|nr:CBS domain-containing protein [Bryobacteraceae bacterium]
MHVQDVMIKNPKFCTPGMNLAAATEILWKAGCGTLPVVENNRVLGMITDRDIAMALGTRNVRASDATVRDVSLPKLFYCAAADDIHIALQTMGAQKVRRLPVLDSSGGLEGILCLDDIVLFAEEKAGDLKYADVVDTLKSICEHTSAFQALAVAR